VRIGLSGGRTGIRVSALDIAAFVLALAVAALMAVRVYSGRSGTPEVHVRSPSQEWILPLDTDRIEEVPGPLGNTVVAIRQGQVRVLSSPCTEKICVKSGAISRPGQWIACLPNGVIVDIRGSTREKVDAYSF
jgi:hypothetical protein